MAKAEPEYLEKLEELYRTGKESNSELPCPRCGKYSEMGLSAESLVMKELPVCPDCAKQEIEGGKIPIEEWAIITKKMDKKAILEKIDGVCQHMKKLQRERERLRIIRIVCPCIIGAGMLALLIMRMFWS